MNTPVTVIINGDHLTIPSLKKLESDGWTSGEIKDLKDRLEELVEYHNINFIETPREGIYCMLYATHSVLYQFLWDITSDYDLDLR